MDEARSTMTLGGKHLVLGVTGSIAAYKAVGVLRALRDQGASVSVVMTRGATKFMTPLTFEVLSGHHVITDLFEAHETMPHLTMAEGADAVLVAPATAHFLAKAAIGLADDVLTTMLLNVRCPVIVAPAMDGEMWTHPTVAQHVDALRARGVVVLDPEVGPLASGRVAQGRLPTEAIILDTVHAAVFRQSDWRGQRVLVSAGPTQEPLDPVRFLSNRSSGKMGYAIAEAVRARGGDVVLVTGPSALTPPSGVTTVHVNTASEMADALSQHFSSCTVLIMAAAVADFRPRVTASGKLKKQGKSEMELALEATPDILAMLSARRTSQVVVGFAAETEQVLAHAKDKLKGKGLDLIVANDVTQTGGGFGSDDNAAVILSATGEQRVFSLMPKRRLADEILNAVRDLYLVAPRGESFVE
ncbi:fused 4'-phosphopantothenoylcysteine decarboxylase; phosphopantothenoylcysteine synthetase, FMN-binding [Candidatus Nitrospira nitrosa]|uniref:Coenzyme A biosynthesis bifunctional protein CoaBC n=1 Tax=Candidatus Nitrospira nitrosa TaxID=1742972 RepID=A0A0S4LRG0_9BACT|nr:bifunctional phosphopantothenoylcysteine decarboxylase/phosphopantothenate--cysteine ligase CoaBC [Candidatus Nitrospira nitrosa]CUS39534.1 fused 4'-phosphopantothenoylcysteine decarboxylase; phosphopantothenoylcysteine synthetase, FMN-binding [Candidatus Nitrospira nitrosa]